DHSFEAAVDTVAAGPVTVQLTNEGVQPHQVHLAKEAPGVTAESFIETYVTDGEPAAVALVDRAGGVNGVEPAATGEATSVLEEGYYLLICFLPTPGPDSKAHLVEGMVGELTVVDTGGRVPEPSASTEIGMADYSVAIPEGFDGGDVVVRNEGREDHELILMRFDDGKGLPDLLAWQEAGMPAERPFGYAGGTGTIPPGAEIWTSLDLEPGDYIALCVIPGPDGAPHVEMGMLTSFTIF